MSRSERQRVLAIGVDAAEPTLVRRLLDRGDLPVLRDLAAEGVSGPVLSPAPLGSAAVWPTFVTGTAPAAHGLYGEWIWRPETMSLARASWDHLEPFWRGDVRAGRAVAVLDVPFAPLLGLLGCSEILDWGAHDRLKGRLEISPPALGRLIAEVGKTHPFTGDVDAAGPQDHAGLKRVVARCLAGVEQRGRLARRLLTDTGADLFVVVFTEFHRAAHLLWHTVDPTHPDHVAGAADGDRGPGLPELLQAVDGEIGRLVDLVGRQATVLVFSLHGMRATRGIPAILEPLLRAGGFTVPQPWPDHSWPQRARRVLSAVKRLAPEPAKRLYYRLLPRAVTSRFAEASMPMPAHDWSRTTAISLPTDQHGWIRLSLRGREARGVVDPDAYDDVCRRLEQALRAARRADGRPIVRDVLRMAADATAAATLALPDLVVHWDDATFASPLRLAEPSVAARAIGLKFTGQHAFEGFYLLRRPGGSPPAGGPIAAERLHRLLGDTVA